MNATKRSAARAGLVVCSLLVVALAGCRTQVVHEHTRTVYVPAPPPQIVNVAPAPAPQPPPPVIVVPPTEPPPVVVIQSENDFYEPLAAYGHWEVVGSYGRVWIPARVEAGWRPYANGYWQRTDAGWYWASEEPWGWATYHYGRWDYHAQFGWIWVPHTQWAPAWVSWREGGGYVGWAPLRPSVSINVNIGTAVREPAFESRAFVFVEHRKMLEPVRPKTVIGNDTTIINQTVNITNVKVVNKTVINEGPRPEVIERESGRKVQSVPAREFRHREEVAVAARERNLPTAPQTRIQPPARTELQPVTKETPPPSHANVVEKPVAVVTSPARPLAATPRPPPPPVESGRLARLENKQGVEPAKKIATTTPTVVHTSKPEVRPAQAVPPRRDVRLAEKPAVVAKLTPQAVPTPPVRDEKKHALVTEKKSPATTPAVKVETASPTTIKKPTAPPSQKPADRPLMSPKEKSRAAERGDANKKAKVDKSLTKKGEDQEASPTVVPPRPAR